MKLDNLKKRLMLSLALLIAIFLIVNFGFLKQNYQPISSEEGYISTYQKITGYGPFPIETFVQILDPESPIITGWIEDLGDYSDGTVFLNWSISNSNSISGYALYKTTDYISGFDFSQPNNTLTKSQTNFSDVDSKNYGEMYYIIRAIYNNYIEQNNHTIGKLTREIYNTPTNSKLNLISIPVNIQNGSLEKVFIQNETNYKITQLYQRNDSTGAYEIVDYYGELGFDTWFGDFNEVEPGKVYWVKTENTTNLSFVGEVIQENKTYELESNVQNKGLNLFGWNSVTRSSIADVINNSIDNYNITQVYRRNDSTGDYQIVDYYGAFGYDLWFGDFDYFEPGYGYWIKTNQNMTLTYEVNVR